MPARALRLSRLVALAAIAALASCTDSNSPTPTENPRFDVSDGGSGGNEDVFFLPPLVESPRGPTYGDRAPNPDLRPDAKICRLNQGDGVAGSSPLACVADVARLPLTYDATGGFYSINWQTGDLSQTGFAPLDPDYYYRIAVVLGTLELAYRDVDPDPGPPSGNCRRRDLFCQFNNGSNVPIKVVIEQFAACIASNDAFDPNAPDAACATASLDDNESLSLNQNGNTIGVAQVNNAGTISLQTCTDLRDRPAIGQGRVDIPTFGDCIEIETYEEFLVSGIATVCDAYQAALDAGMTATQADRMTVYRFGHNDDAAVALPHSDAATCEQGAQVQQSRLEQFALLVRRTVRTAWHAARTQVLAWLEPKPLLASAAVAVCNKGGCGSATGFESSFQAALDFWGAYDASNPNGDLGTHDAGTVVTGKIRAWDSGELESGGTPVPEPVANARLTVSIVTGGGTVSNGTTSGTSVTIFTNSSGVGSFTLTVAPGPNVVKVSAIGMGLEWQGDGNPVNNVYAPPMSGGTETELAVGELLFTANGNVVFSFVPDPPGGGATIYADASGIATIPDFKVCGGVAGAEITSLAFIKNNGDPVTAGGLPTFPVTTGTDGCYLFQGVTINKTGAYRLVVNGTYTSQKINIKPTK